MTTSWGGTSIPDPVSIEEVELFKGTQYDTADGTLNTDSIATRKRYNIAWGQVTTTEHGTIRTKATTNSSASLVLPVYGTVTVVPVRGSFRSSVIGGASTKLNCSCTVETTS